MPSGVVPDANLSTVLGVRSLGTTTNELTDQRALLLKTFRSRILRILIIVRVGAIAQEVYRALQTENHFRDIWATLRIPIPTADHDPPEIVGNIWMRRSGRSVSLQNTDRDCCRQNTIERCLPGEYLGRFERSSSLGNIFRHVPRL